MAQLRSVELDELVNRPGTYFNPQTEIVVIVDDSSAVDAEAFDGDVAGEGEWVLISDEVPVDDSRRDELLEAVAVRLAGGAELEAGDDETVEDEDELEPDAEEE